MGNKKCSECDITVNLTKCDEKTCDKMYCEIHVKDFLNECQGCGFYCEDDSERVNDEMACCKCKEAFDDQEY